jgi:hypothetical protein
MFLIAEPSTPANSLQLAPIYQNRCILSPYLETKAEELIGCVGYKGPRKSLKEMEAAIAKGERKKL